jgi:methylated-DNA-[protein]-cysteine S-methyltransferase
MRGMSELARRAHEEGLLDVAFAPVDAPFGTLLAAATPRGLVRLALQNQPRDEVLQELADRVSPRVLFAPERLDPVRRELDEYFAGRRNRFELPIDWTLVRGFHRRVLEATARIAYGNVRTYSEVAAEGGSPRAVRAAGNALAGNPICIVVPCHRVLRRGGGLGGYAGGLEVKRFLLELESAPA